MEPSQSAATVETPQEIVAHIDQKAIRLSALLRDIDNHPIALNSELRDRLDEILEMVSSQGHGDPGAAAPGRSRADRRREPRLAVHLFAVGTCSCVLPARLHLRPDGLHLPDGSDSTIDVVDEVWSDGPPLCSVCGSGIDETFYRCGPCEAVLCRVCLAGSVAVVECDCLVEVGVTGVQLAARLAAAARPG